jgi:hypothetical protein
VARKRERTEGVQRAYLWAQEVRAMLDHVYGIESLKATETAPLFFFTRAWYGTRRHCDPENTQKLLKDALFYLDDGAKDKYTGGAYAGPLYDAINPRVEAMIWRLSAEATPKLARPEAPKASKAPKRRTKKANPFQ